MVDRPEACPEWREDLADWAVAQVLPDREAALLAHLDTCDACRAEAESLLAVAAVVLAVDADPSVVTSAVANGRAGPAPERVDPPVDLGQRIAGRIAAERRGRLWRRVALTAVGAAAAAAVVVGAVLAVADDGPGRLDGKQFAFTVLPDGGRASAVVAPYDGGESSEVQLVASGLDPETTYALWLAVPGGGRDERVAAGTFRPDEDGAVDVRLLCAMPAGEVGRVWATSPENELVLDTA